mmetsp:Transcript_5657/g.8596  ORF Transcript_5657/g.8596 Transcript_5657/m.8596 type:complete len:298 (+) Transcript_5657:36-929(+)
MDFFGNSDPLNESECAAGQDKSILIRIIMRDSSKTPEEKQKLIQRILSGNTVDSSTSGDSQEKECDYQCPHYEKKCSKFYFDCCQRRDQCHRCHKERSTSCAAPKITEIVCDDCGVHQEPARSCIQCKVEFSNSFCAICNIWTVKEIFHCNDCGLCRVGKGDEHFHCSTCNGCFMLSSRSHHVCVFRPMDEEDCPICHEKIHTAQSTSTPLPCRHIVHTPCFNKSLRAGEYRCPSCRRSMADMEHVWEDIRRSIAAQPMEQVIPVQYICYDCGHKGDGTFHFLGIECSNCHSYNTAR